MFGLVVGDFSAVLWHIWFFFVSRGFFFWKADHIALSTMTAARYHSACLTAWVHPPQSNGSYITEQLEGDTVDGARTQAEEQTASPYSKCPEEKKTKIKTKNPNPKTIPKNPHLIYHICL